MWEKNCARGVFFLSCPTETIICATVTSNGRTEALMPHAPCPKLHPITPPHSSTASGPATPAPGIGRPQVADVTRDTSVEEAATRLANDLRAVPGIERFGTMRLADLDTSGPRPLRTMWRVAREELSDSYGQLTIGEVIDRYAGSVDAGT